MEAVIALMLEDENDGEEQLERPLRYNLQSIAWQMSDRKFVKMFRLTKEMANELIEQLRPALPPRSRVSAIPSDVRVLAALCFFASGSYQMAIAQNKCIDICQRSVSRCMQQVCDAMLRRFVSDWIRFPTTQAEQLEVKKRFYEDYNFPGVVGAIDCTHVAIVPPPVNDPNYPEHAYINHKNFHSINVQLIADCDRKILAACARYSGRTHDSYVWRNSDIKHFLSDAYNAGSRNTWLLGDSGYPQEPWLMTPYGNVEDNSPEELYNRKHMAARSIVECTIGTLKQRWRCLLKHRVLHYRPPVASKIINVCIALHNFCMHHNMPVFEEDGIQYEDEELPNIEHVAQRGNRVATLGQQTRDAVVRRYFAR